MEELKLADIIQGSREDDKVGKEYEKEKFEQIII
jgi:hypothetical protein